MEGVKGVSQLKLQPKLSEVQKKVQAMCEWKKYVIKKECKKIQVQRAVNVHTVPETFYFPT